MDDLQDKLLAQMNNFNQCDDLIEALRDTGRADDLVKTLARKLETMRALQQEIVEKCM